MASVRPEVPDKTAQSAAQAAAAVNVPQLRDAVVLLTEAVQRLEQEIIRIRIDQRRAR